MPKLRTLMSTPLADTFATFEAMAFLVIARVLVRFVPLRRWRKQFGAIADPAAPTTALRADEVTKARMVATAIQRADRNLPLTFLCLPQALAARWMLERRGVPATLHIGGRKGKDGGHEFHAWVLAGEHWITGGNGEAEYSAFTHTESSTH